MEAVNHSRINSINLCLFLASLVVIGIGLYQTKMVVIPLFIAYLFYLIVTPLIDFLGKKFRFPKRAYATIILIFLSAFSFIFFKYFWETISLLLSESDIYIKQFRQFVSNYLYKLGSQLPGFSTDEAMKGPIVSIVEYSSIGIKDFITISFLTFLCSLFFIFDPLSIRRIGRNKAIIRLESKLRRYVWIKSITSLITGSLIYFYLLFLDYEFAFFLGFGTFLLNFIPSFGSIVATLMLIPIFKLEGNSPSELFLFLIFPASVQFLIGNIIEPKFMGEALHLSPVVIILSLILWSIIFGVYGLFLGVPLTLAVFSVLKNSNLQNRLFEN